MKFMEKVRDFLYEKPIWGEDGRVLREDAPSYEPGFFAKMRDSAPAYALSAMGALASVAPLVYRAAPIVAYASASEACANDDPTGPNPFPSASPSPNSRNGVYGDVTNRSDAVAIAAADYKGSPIEATTITFRGKSGQAIGVTAKENVINGSYQMPNLPPGTYSVLINDETGNRVHIEHQTMDVSVGTSNPPINFSVRKYGPGRYTMIDSDYEDFFNQQARGQDLKDIWKWERQPTEIYMTEEGITPEALDAVYSILQKKFGDGNISAMSCGRAEIALRRGPPIGDFVSGKVVLRFDDQPAGTGYLQDSPKRLVKAARIHLRKSNYNVGGYSDENKEVEITHELTHAIPVLNHVIRDNKHRSTSAMYANVMSLNDADKQVVCDLAHQDTHAGNHYRDINDTYMQPVSTASVTGGNLGAMIRRHLSNLPQEGLEVSELHCKDHNKN